MPHAGVEGREPILNSSTKLIRAHWRAFLVPMMRILLRTQPIASVSLYELLSAMRPERQR